MVMLQSSLCASMNAKLIGSGDKTLVLAHGFGGEQSLWEQIVPHLAERFQVVVFDWNFSGAAKDSNSYDSSKYSSFEAFSDDLIALVDEMNLKRFVFVGHSMSGIIGCMASIKRPELFERIVLVSASPRYINSEEQVWGFDMPVIDDILSNIESNFCSWAANFASLAMDPEDHSAIEKFRNSLQKMRPDVALSVAKTIFLSDNTDILEKVEVPCTIVQATNDIVVPMSAFHYMEEKMKPVASSEIIEANGHFPHLTCPQLLIEVLDKILGYEKVCLTEGEEKKKIAHELAV